MQFKILIASTILLSLRQSSSALIDVTSLAALDQGVDVNVGLGTSTGTDTGYDTYAFDTGAGTGTAIDNASANGSASSSSEGSNTNASTDGSNNLPIYPSPTTPVPTTTQYQPIVTPTVTSPVVTTTKPNQNQNQNILQWLNQGISNLASLPSNQNYGLVYTPYGYNIYPAVQNQNSILPQVTTQTNVNSQTNNNTNSKPNNLLNYFSGSVSSIPLLSSGSNSIKNQNVSPFTSVLSQASNLYSNLRGK